MSVLIRQYCSDVFLEAIVTNSNLNLTIILLKIQNGNSFLYSNVYFLFILSFFFQKNYVIIFHEIESMNYNKIHFQYVTSILNYIKYFNNIGVYYILKKFNLKLINGFISNILIT